MTGRRLLSGAVRLIDGAVSLAMLAVFLLLFAFAAYVQWDSRQMASSAGAVAYEAYKPTDAEHLTFTQLTERNPDVFGWLTLDDTAVDYPLVQGTDNDRYVNTDPLGNFALSGSIFLDYRNRRDFTDPVSILHGHHMSGDVMFGGFDRYADADWFDAHRTGVLYFDGAAHALDVFAFIRADAYDETVYNPFVTPGEKRDYLLQVLALAVTRSDVDVDTDRPILMMSTCETGETNGRMLLAALVGDALPEAAADAAPARGRAIPWPWIGGGAAAALAVVGLLVHKKRRSGAGEESVMEQSRKQPSVLGDIVSLLLKLLLIAAAFAALFTLVFGLHIGADRSMAPAVKDRDMVVYYRLDKSPDARELVVYADNDGARHVGRVIAAAGDQVDVTSEGVKINGYLQAEDYAVGETLAYVQGPDYPVQLGERQYFIMGDNRAESADSRAFGPIDSDRILGRVITVIRRRDF